ncbi:MAG: aldehyde ferredoxin oxidoreductase N-terminal domain-containing protein, partial [Candidatus Bathyarchaeia archaeon]
MSGIEKFFIGGSGLAPWILYNDLAPKLDPLDPDSEIIFSTGPLVGTGIIGGNRTVISGKSPLSETYYHCHGGGFFGAELRATGLSHIIITGRSKNPVYLMIDDDRVEIKDARHLWGRTISEADEIIKKDVGDRKIKTA